MPNIEHIRFFPGEGELRFSAIFEERCHYVRNYTLPFNILIGILDDDDRSCSTVRNLRTGQEWIRRRDHLFFVPCNLPVQYTTCENLRYIAIIFSLEQYPGGDVFAGQSHWTVEHAPDSAAAMNEAFRTEDRLLALSKLREFCLNFCNRHWPKPQEMPSRQARFLQTLHDIREHATAQTTVAELAAKMDLRLESFSREFTGAFGRTPKDFIQNELALKATILLRHPDYNVARTAKKLKFSDEFYFSKFFKRRIGCSPSEYRSQYRELVLPPR